MWIRQPEIFAKLVTDGASTARRHLDKSVMRYLINVGGELPPFHFSFQAALLYKLGSLKMDLTL